MSGKQGRYYTQGCLSTVTIAGRDQETVLLHNRAVGLGNKFFAVLAQKQCFTHRDAGKTYAKHGKAEHCTNGKGGPWKLDVYQIIGRTFVALPYSRRGSGYWLDLSWG